MITYDISGTFYEACDCEVICSCWVGEPPEMGSCTGMFVWYIQTGTVEGVSVSNSKVAVLSSGQSCDISKYMLILIEGSGSPELQRAFEETGPWNDVFQAQSFAVGSERATHPAKITITDVGVSVGISIQDPAATPPNLKVIDSAELNFAIKPAHLIGEGQTGKGLLINRVVGEELNKSVDVGIVDNTLTPTKNGLNLLADIPTKYTFDLDVNRVTAMRGKFRYKQ